jgi:DNA-binding MarR family transcriptional regulator
MFMPQKSQKLVQLLEKVSEKIKEQICDDSFMASGLTLAQFRLLQYLANQEQSSMASIAKHLQIKPASATSLVNRLVQQGWLVRKGDEKDRRKVYVEIAQNKREEWDSQQQEQAKRLAQFMDVLTDKQKDEFISILETLESQHS